MQSLKTIELRVDQDVIASYADLTEDYNPLHIDPDFAAQSPFGGIIAHGTLSLNLIWQAFAATFGSQAAENAVLDIRFKNPVRVGDTITAGGDFATAGNYDVWARNQGGVNVIEGTLRIDNGAGSQI